MGESKRRAERQTPVERLADEMSRDLANRGKLIEAGWAAYLHLFVPTDAPPDHVAALRFAYMAGSQHLWAGIMTTFDPGIEETPADMDRLSKIQAELDAWAAEAARDHYPTRGSA